MYYFIINPKSKSNRGKQIWERVREDLDKLNIPYKFFFTKHKGHATELATLLCQTIVDDKNLVVLGGDGTLNEVINGITDFNSITLSYIPSGSSNDFARSLHISSDVKEALSTVLAPERQVQVDIGELEILDEAGNIQSNRRFAVSCGIGYDASICFEASTSKIKKVLNSIGLGKLTYGLIAAKQALGYHATPAKLILDGNEALVTQNSFFLVGMVHPYEGGGAKLTPDANYSDKKLSICFVHDMPRWKVFLLLPTAFVAKHTGLRGVSIYECNSLELIQANNKITHVDGEYSGTCNHIRLCCNRHTLTVNVPV